MNNNQIYSYANTQQAEQEKENKLASLLTPENIQMAIQLGVFADGGGRSPCDGSCYAEGQALDDVRHRCGAAGGF